MPRQPYKAERALLTQMRGQVQDAVRSNDVPAIDSIAEPPVGASKPVDAQPIATGTEQVAVPEVTERDLRLADALEAGDLKAAAAILRGEG